MPASGRYARVVEVGVSSLLFGALEGVLLRKEEERATMPAPPVEPDRR